MKVTIRLAFGLSIFLVTAGTVYAVTAQEWQGAVLILACSAAALYIGISLRVAERHAALSTDIDPGAGEPSEEPEEVPQTIWPFVVSIAALLLVIGAVGIHWILILSVIVFVGAGAGWFMEIQRQRVHASGAEVSALQGHEQPDDRDGS
jgi:Cytochrome c oxidase subunit IV